MFFIVGKIFWAVVQPGNLLLILLCAGLLFAALRLRRTGFALIGIAAAGYLVLAVLPVGSATLMLLEQRIPRPQALPPRIDGILILGGAVDERVSLAYGETMFNSAVGRVLAGVVIARRHPEARLGLIGGEGGFFPIGYSEARATLDFAREAGIAPDRIAIEERSRSTRENAVFAKELLRPRPGEVWVLVTSAYHMPRALGVFRALDWPILAYPADYRVDPATGLRPDFNMAEGLGRATLAAKEWIGLVAYRLKGWSPELFPRP